MCAWCIYIQIICILLKRSSTPFAPGPDKQQNRRARLINGKSRTRYSSKWQTQPPPTARRPARVFDSPRRSPFDFTDVCSNTSRALQNNTIYRSPAVSANRTRPLDAVSRSPEVYGGAAASQEFPLGTLYTQTHALCIYTYYVKQTIQRIYRRTLRCLPKPSSPFRPPRHTELARYS